MDKWTGSPTNFKRIARDAKTHECRHAPSQRTIVWRLVLSEDTPTVAIRNSPFANSL